MKLLLVSYLTKLFSSKSLLYLILIFTLIDCNNAYVEPNQDKSQIEFDKFKQNHSLVEIYFMYITIIIILLLGTLCTLYVILRTFIRWRRIELTLNMSHKLPFYMASSGKYFGRNAKIREILNFETNLCFSFYLLIKI